jgi:DNA-binding MarR family transcriptional regulator
MIEEPPGAPDAVVDAVVQACRALVGITARALAAASDEVTLPQLRTLVVVAHQGPQTVSVLAERLDVHASTMTRMCSRLVARGLVTRTPSATDRREVVVELTPEGRRLADEVVRRRREEIDAVIRRMPVDDRDRIVAALELFARAASGASGAQPVAGDVATTIAPPVPITTA